MALRRFGVSLEDELLAALDNFARDNGFANRSQAIRFLIEKNITEEKWQCNHLVAGTVVLMYDRTAAGISRQIDKIQQDYLDVILSSSQYYINRYHKAMEKLNVLPPSIEPFASGHIIEQIEYIKEILAHGYAYESNGSVYFDVPKYNHDFHYGKLSGRNIDELFSATRQLDGQQEKHNPADFALWKKAAPEHIMHWPSPWSEGFPGWHLECSTMGQKYLGETFDIHGGGMDLIFPHHECEIAQSVAHSGHDAVRYWMHNNMITINGQKMGKSLGNFITLDEFFTGSRKDMLSQPYSPMTIRFFILQAHYGGTVDFSNEALQAAQKAYERMLDGWKRLNELKPLETSTVNVTDLDRKCHEAMNDDLNTPVVIAHLFEACRAINLVNDGKATISAADLEQLKATFKTFLFDILGIYDERESGSVNLQPYEQAVDLLLEIRKDAKGRKDWATSDLIRNRLSEIGFDVKDTKDGFEWKVK